jgi:hypothetical protein
MSENYASRFIRSIVDQTPDDYLAGERPASSIAQVRNTANSVELPHR